MTRETPPPAPLLKDILGPQALATIAEAGAATSPHFDAAAFLDAAGAGLDALSIMERVRHIADALALALPDAYPEALEIVIGMAPLLKHGFQAVAVTEFVARQGLGDGPASLAALARLTRFGSAEFAIRPFLARDPATTLAEMLAWSESEDEHLRRLASEGCRPRLPWAARVPALKADPTLGAAILEKLRADDSPYVRKSVANHLNDIAKDDPAWVLARLGTWPQDNAHTRWILRHALRTLIKQGNPAALALIGAVHGAAVEVRAFSVSPQSVRLGDVVTIEAELVSVADDIQRIVVDYRVHYARLGGKSAAKVFKLKTFDLAPHAAASVAIRQTIRDFSTRRHHPGTHAIDLLVNGEVMASAAFDLV